MIPTLYKTFQHWSETGSVYILSGLHFSDDDCKKMDPEWIEPEEQIKRINDMVMKVDTFVCLGDVGNAKYLAGIKARKKVLLLGNHDNPADYKDYFQEIYTGPLFIADKTRFDNGMNMEIPHSHNMANAMYGLTPILYAKLISARWSQILERKDEYRFWKKLLYRILKNKFMVQKRITSVVLFCFVCFLGGRKLGFLWDRF